jgi:Tfp pilus assembly pilus retraction ATPase PilT
MSSHFPICLETQFKQRIPHVKTAIQSALGVGSSTTHAYDILAVSQGFANYQSAKGRAQMPYYEWGLNIGTTQAPYFIMKAIGHHRNPEEARNAGAPLLLGSPDHVSWVLFENGQATPVSFSAQKEAISWDLRNVHGSLLQAANHHVSALRLRQMGGKSIVDYQTRKGWVSSGVLSDVCSNDPSNIMSQLKALAAHVDKEHQPDLLSFGIQVDGVLVHVRVHVLRTQDGPIINIRLHDPIAHQYLGALLEGCPAFQRLRMDVNEAKNGLFLIVGRTGSGSSTTTTYLMTTTTTHLSSQKNALNSRGVVDEVNPIAALSMSDIHQKLMRADADIVCAGEIRDGNALSAALDAAQTKPVIAVLHASDAHVLLRLQSMGADMNSLHGVLKGVYSQCLMRSADQGVVIPVSSYQFLDEGKLIGLNLIEEARLLHLRGGISDSEMHNQFGQDF